MTCITRVIKVDPRCTSVVWFHGIPRNWPRQFRLRVHNENTIFSLTVMINTSLSFWRKKCEMFSINHVKMLQNHRSNNQRSFIIPSQYEWENIYYWFVKLMLLYLLKYEGLDVPSILTMTSAHHLWSIPAPHFRALSVKLYVWKSDTVHFKFYWSVSM